MQDRRSVIKAVCSLAALNTVGSAATAAQKKRPNDNPEQLDKEVLQAFQQNGSVGIERLMERRGLESVVDETIITPGEGLAPNREFTEYSLTSNVFKVGEDKIRIQLIADLRDWKIGFEDSSYVDDIMGLAYRTEHWTSVGTSIRTPSDYHDMDPWEGSLNGGYAVRVKISPEGIVRENDNKHNFLTAVTLKSDTGVPNTVVGHYCHNSAASPTGHVNEVSSGGIGMNVNLSLGAGKVWQEGHDVEVEEASIF